MLMEKNKPMIGVPAHPPARRSRRRLGAIVAAAALLALGGWAAYHYLLAEPAPQFRTAAVERGNLEATVTSLGSVKPRDYVDVGAQVSGQLKKVHVEIGDRVDKGQLLAEIDPTVFETRVSADRAKLTDLEAQLVQQQAEHKLVRQQDERNQRLLKINAISRDAVEQGETAVAVAAARIDSLKAQIAQARSTLDGDVANLGYAKIYAPMNGTVVSQTAIEGQTLNANQTAPVILRIADLETMTVWAQVAEADVVKLTPGMPVYFTTLGLPDRRWRASVRQIMPTPEVVNDVVLYNVLIDIGNPDRTLMTDMTAQIFFVLGEAKDALLVPVAALRPAQDGAEGVYRVRVLTAQGIEQRKVRIGLQNRVSAEVLSGLAEGDIVVTGTQSAADPGQQRGSRRGARL